MNKKIIVVTLIAVLLTVTLSSTMAVAKTAAEESGTLFGVFNSAISIEKDEEIDEPMHYLDSEEIKLTVGFKLDLNSIAQRLLFNRRIGRMILFGPGYILKTKSLPKATIDLELSDIPEWCTAELDNTSVELNYGTSLDEAEATLTIKANETALALESANITITAKYSGHWTIKGASSTTSIEFMSAYEPGLEYEEEIEKKVPPINETYIPINITNIGNGVTEVEIVIENYPVNWNVSLDKDSIVIPADEGDDTRQVNLIVEPLDEDFDNETIYLILTPKSTSDADVDSKYLEGDSVTLSVFIQNDGSLEDENGEIGIEIILSAALIIIVIIILALVYILFKRKEE